MIRVLLPTHLRTLAKVEGEIRVEVAPPPTLRAVLTALEENYPALQGTMRDHGSGERRPLIRFFACEEDWSHEGLDAVLPEKVANGREPLLVVGAIAGG